MDTRLRLLAKSVSWQLSGLLVMALVGYVITGSVSTGGTIALSGAVIGFVTYIVHEYLWGLVRWGRGDRT